MKNALAPLRTLLRNDLYKETTTAEGRRSGVETWTNPPNTITVTLAPSQDGRSVLADIWIQGRPGAISTTDATTEWLDDHLP